MSSLNRRDAVGLAALALGLAVSLSFLGPSVGSHADGPGVISHGQLVDPTAMPATPTLTPVPAVALGVPPKGWIVQYYDYPDPAGVIDTELTAPTLELAFPGAPFPNMHNDRWSLVAQATYDVPAGRYSLTIEHDGGVRIFADGKDLASQPDAEIPRVLRVELDHGAGPLTLRMEARDTGGPFALRQLIRE